MAPHSPAVRPAIAFQEVVSEKLVVHVLYFEARMVDMSLVLVRLAEKERL